MKETNSFILGKRLQIIIYVVNWSTSLWITKRKDK